MWIVLAIIFWWVNVMLAFSLAGWYRKGTMKSDLLAIAFLVIVPAASMISGVFDGLDEELSRLVPPDRRTWASRAYLAGRNRYERFRASIRKALRNLARRA